MYASAISSSLVLRECFNAFAFSVMDFSLRLLRSIARRGLTGQLTRPLIHYGGGGVELKSDAEQPVVEPFAAYDGGQQRHALLVRFAARQRDFVLLPQRHGDGVNDPHASDRQVLEDHL